MNKWIENLIKLNTEGNPGKCPHCNSDRVDYGYTLYLPDEDLGTFDMWCDDCRRAFHGSRVVVDRTAIKEIPKDLVY